MPAIAVKQRQPVELHIWQHCFHELVLRACRLGGVAEDAVPADFLDTPQSRPAGDASNASGGEQAASGSPGSSDQPTSTSAEPQDPG